MSILMNIVSYKKKREIKELVFNSICERYGKEYDKIKRKYRVKGIDIAHYMTKEEYIYSGVKKLIASLQEEE